MSTGSGSLSHLCTKSSVFHPVQLGAGGQQEIYRHMKRHYDRLERVTPATDTSPPISHKQSTLQRDRGKKYQAPDTLKPPPMSKLLLERESELISLPTKDSDVRSILQHFPDLRKTLKYPESTPSSLDTGVLENIANSRGAGRHEGSRNSNTAISNEDWQRDIENSPGNQNAASAGHQITGTPVKGAGTPVKGTTTTLGKGATTTTPRMSEDSEELKYLQFISGITRDILTSGISSDRALNMLFSRHVTMNKGLLNEAIMWRKIEELKMKLNIIS